MNTQSDTSVGAESVEVADGQIHYRFDGPLHLPVIVLSHSLGANLSMWDSQIPALSAHFRVLSYDVRGHGASAATPGEYSVEKLGRDVVGLIDTLGIPNVNFCGLSIGGLIGMWLGLHAPERMKRLVLSNTGAHIGNPDIWNARMDIVREKGAAAICESVLQRWFTPSFCQREPIIVDRFRQMIASTSPDGYVGCCAAVRDADLRDPIAGLRLPTLVIAGSHDVATTPADGRFLAERIAGAKYVELDAAHISNVEAAEQYTDEVLRFLTA